MHTGRASASPAPANLMKPGNDHFRFGNETRRQKAILNEVAHHLKRGRTPERIAVWMNKPMSIITQAILRVQQEQQQP